MPFTILPSVTNEHYFYVVLQAPGLQTYEAFEGTFDECRDECHELNMRIATLLSQHIMNEEKKSKIVVLDPWSSLLCRKK